MNKQLLIKQLQEQIALSKGEWLTWYQGIIADSLDESLKTDEDKIAYLEDLEGDGEYDSLMFSQGYVMGLQEAINVILAEKGK